MTLKDSGRPRTWLISFVAVNAQDIIQLNLTSKRKYKFFEKSCLPRIMNKLTLCVNPMAIIVHVVTDLTGLDNYNLSGQSKYTKLQ